MSFHAEWPTPGALHSGVLSGHVLDLGVNPLNAQKAQADLLMNRVKQPVVNLEGTWTSPGLNNMTLTNGENPFEYHLSIAQVNPGAVSYTHLTLPTKRIV